MRQTCGYLIPTLLRLHCEQFVIEWFRKMIIKHIWVTCFFKKKWFIPSLFFVYFRLSKQTLQFLQEICEKCPSSIRGCDSNPQPSEPESPPITTTPGLPTKRLSVLRWRDVLVLAVLNYFLFKINVFVTKLAWEDGADTNSKDVPLR